jgi:FMN phosphatase YigB (HAD superfamily)
MRVFSFDIFDTLLVRSQARPEDLFWEMGVQLRNQGHWQKSPTGFAQARAQAELQSRKKYPGGEVTFDEIYQELSRELGWTQALTARAQELELALEAKSLRPVPGMVDRVTDARKQGGCVWFLSDMYLPSEFLTQILRQNGFFQDGDRICVSGEIRTSKANGGLYDWVRGQIGKPIEAWRHLGDNPQADVAVPRRLGIQAEELPAARLNRYEELASGPKNHHDLWQTYLAGSMRLSRLANPESAPDRRVLWNTGCDLVGPLWFGFVRWCLDEAARLGLKRLYFISRDGQILHRIAQRITARWPGGVECRYLYGSRQAWHRAGLAQIVKEDLFWILRPSPGLTLQRVFQRMGLDPIAFVKVLTAAGFPTSQWTVPLTPIDLERLGDFLISESLQPAIRKATEPYRLLVQAYLRQEGFGDGVVKGMVDIGWHGNLQRSLSRTLDLFGWPEARQLTGLYLGLVQQPANGTWGTFSGYWNRRPKGALHLRRQNLALLEMFAAADHGSVLGYRSQGSRIEPVLDPASEQRARAWGVTTLHQAILAFTDHFLSVLDNNDIDSMRYQELSEQLLHLFYTRPTGEEARTWGHVPFSDGQVEDHLQRLIPQAQPRQIRSAVLRRSPECYYWWIEGYLAINPNANLRILHTLKTLKHKIADRLKSP